MIRPLIAFCAAALIAAPALAKPAPPPSPAVQEIRAFVDGLYRQVERDDPTFCGTCGEHRRAVFDAPMVAVLDEDDRLTPAGEVGAYDADPLCQCQDPGGLKASISGVQLTGKGTARVAMTLDFTDSAPRVLDHVTLLMVRTPGGWRIHDILDTDGMSFRQMVAEANVEARKGQGGK